MKILIKLFAVFILLISPVMAITFDVLVLPADLLNQKENYYNFDEVSEIIANDIIKNFNSSNGKIKSPDLYEVRAKLNKSPELKKTVNDLLEKYKDTNKLDYEEIKKAGSAFSCKSVLIVSSYAVTNKNSKKRGIWEVLNISSAFDISYPYRLETSVVLLDTVNNLVMWSNNYSAKLGANDNIFAAKNYAQANAELEKIKLYSKTIVSSSASQNIMLRFFPKAVRPVENKVEDTNGGALKYERTLPQTRKDENKNEDIPYSGDMIYGI